MFHFQIVLPENLAIYIKIFHDEKMNARTQTIDKTKKNSQSFSGFIGKMKMGSKRAFFRSVGVSLGVVFLMTGCQDKNKKADQNSAVRQSEGTTGASVSPSDQDFQVFIQQLRRAVANRDMEYIASQMTPNFGYRLNPLGEGAGVFEYWDVNNVWSDLDRVIRSKFIGNGNFLVAPPEFAASGTVYNGYRAGMLKINGEWKFAYFVKD